MGMLEATVLRKTCLKLYLGFIQLKNTQGLKKGMNMKKEETILFSGGIKGAEAEFGANAERYGIEEVNFTFEGHSIVRGRGLRVLNHEEMKNGDVSLEYIS
jgi:hypothetical protein